MTVKDAVTIYVQHARKELGIPEYQVRDKGGGADDFIQRLRTQGLLSPAYTGFLEPIEPGWSDEWRLLYLPPHDVVRQLSLDPVYQQLAASGTHNELLVTLRNPAVPRLRVYVGQGASAGSAFPARRGLYFLGLPNSLYIGKSDEFGVRSGQHKKVKQASWFVFVSPEDDEHIFTLDSLDAAEGLLISLGNEVSSLENRNRGSDRRPATMYLQQAVLTAMGAWAVLLWLIREQAGLSISPGLGTGAALTFHPKSCRVKGWPDCYLHTP